MAHMLTLLTRVYRARRGSLDQGKYRIEGDVFYLLRFFLTMPSRDTPASSRTEASHKSERAQWEYLFSRLFRHYVSMCRVGGFFCLKSSLWSTPPPAPGDTHRLIMTYCRGTAETGSNVRLHVTRWLVAPFRVTPQPWPPYPRCDYKGWIGRRVSVSRASAGCSLSQGPILFFDFFGPDALQHIAHGTQHGGHSCSGCSAAA